MARSLIVFPLRLGLRGASIAVDGAATVAGHALGIAGRLAEVLTKDGDPDLDIDGSPPEPREAPQPRRRPAADKPSPSRARTRGERSAPAPASSAPAPVQTPEPAPVQTPEPAPVQTPEPAPVETPEHVSEEPTLVDEVAEPGAEDGAGAEIHVEEPWENYDELAADDVIDRITGGSTAVLAAVQLYEQTHRRRKTVIEAVERELRRAGTQ